MSREWLGRLDRPGFILCLAASPALLASVVIEKAAGLHGLAAGPHPYFQAGHAGLLYLGVPLAVLGTLVLFLAPGLILAGGDCKGNSLPSWLLRGFGWSLAVAVLETAVSAWLWPGTRPPGGFAAWAFGALCLLAAAAAWWSRGRTGFEAPTQTGPRWAPIRIAMLPVVGLLLVLLPKFLWEDFNGDGIHAFLASRLLLWQAWPFWDPEVGVLAGFPGVTSMLFTWPNAWFLRVIGETEAAVRLPILLYLAMTATAVAAVAEVGRRPLPRAGWVAVWLGLASFTMAMAFSATYNPYHADLALPGVQDTLLMVCLLAWVHALLREEWPWAVGFGLATAASLPSGLLLMGLWVVGHGMASRLRPWRSHLAASGVLLLCALAVWGLPRVLTVAGIAPPGDEYAGGELLRYLEYLQFTDLRRVAFAAIPAGLFPVLVLGWWRGQDAAARGLSLACVAYFGFFFVQAHVSLHHFVPAMILPMAVAARSIPEAPARARRYLVAWSGLAVLAVGLALPRTFRPHTTAREVGQLVGQELGDFRAAEARVLRAADLLTRLAPEDWDRAVPSSSYGGSPYVWMHYGAHGEAARGAPVLLAPVDADTSGFNVVARSAEAILAVRDRAVVDAVRALRPATDVGSPHLRVPRGILFRGHPLEHGPRIFALADLRRRIVGWFADD